MYIPTTTTTFRLSKKQDTIKKITFIFQHYIHLPCNTERDYFLTYINLSNGNTIRNK